MKRFVVLFIVFLLAGFAFTREANAQIFTNEKLITVDIGSQKLYAWEGGKIINQSIASTGMFYTPTLKGEFKIKRKFDSTNMKGNYPPYEPYSLKNVPNVMYYDGAYAIHGAYWHNKFGSRVTHGCVNLPVTFSKWLYDWAPVGTRIYIF